jgi:hypothetical protein
MRFYKLPGTQRQRAAAKNILVCEKINSHTFQVWGGRDKHVVKKLWILRYSCDCYCNTVEKKICSHIIKVMMFEGVYPQRKLEPIE